MLNQTKNSVQGQYPDGVYQEDNAGAACALLSTSIIRHSEPPVNSTTTTLDELIDYHQERYWFFEDQHRPWDAYPHGREYGRLYRLRWRLQQAQGGAS